MAKKKITILVFGLLFVGIWSWGLAGESGAVPTRIKVQGRIMEGSRPMTGTRYVSFRIYDELSGTRASLWSELNRSVTFDTSGVFDVILGEVTPINIDFLGEDHYLEVRLPDRDPFPRQRLISTPYAITTKNLKGGIVDAGGTINTSASYQIGGNNIFSALNLYEQNVFAGIGAGRSNSTGKNNTFLGDYAGQANTVWWDNTFLGHYAGYSSDKGGNTFVGESAGYNNTTGNQNIFLGQSAGYSNTTGYANTYLGRSAGYYGVTDTFNTFAGYNTGNKNTTGGDTFVGTYTGQNNTTGHSNSFLGTISGLSNTIGSSNTFLGSGAGVNNTMGINNIFIGYSAGYNETNSYRLYIDNSNTASPLIYGYFDPDFPDRPLNRIKINGNLGVGVDRHLTYRLTLPTNTDNSGKGVAYAWATYSSIRWKDNIRPIDDPIGKIKQLRGVYFDWKKNKQRDLGMIAEEVGRVIPEVVSYEDNGKDASGLDYNRLVALLVEVIKEQRKKISSLKQEMLELKGNR